MDIFSTMLGGQGTGAVQQLGQQFGLSDDQVGSALSALLPALATGVQRNTSSAGGLDALMGALTNGSHQQYLDDPTSLARPEAVQDGNGILGHIFGSKDVSRQVAARAATQTGISPDLLKQMLPMVAAMLMGAMSKRTAQPGSAVPGAGGGGLLDMLSPMLDQNRDGSAFDDVLGSVGKWLGGSGR